MTQLTEERFEKILTEKLSPLATRSELQNAVAPLATKDQVEELARDGFDDIQKRLDVTAQIKSFERKFEKLEEALHIKL